MDELVRLECQRLLDKFLKEATYECIKYDWDCGHCYSYIDHPVYDKLSEMIDDCVDLELRGQLEALQEQCNEWLYSNDDCPPCQIYVNSDGTGGQGCCDDVRVKDKEETLSQVMNLIEAAKVDRGCVCYLVQKMDENKPFPPKINELIPECDCALSYKKITKESVC